MDLHHYFLRYLASLLCFIWPVVQLREFSSPPASLPNNVCPTFADYFTIHQNSRCWYDFSVDANVSGIIRGHGYPVEEHQTITSDGYILTVFRIPSRKQGTTTTASKGPVFLLHGVHGSAAIFLALGNQSLAFLLHDAGYDVWLGNYRGTDYSNKHTTLHPEQVAYWQYTADDIALMDVPAMLQLVRAHSNTNEKIIYIGHSLGTTTALMYSSSLPLEAQGLIKILILLAPSYVLPNMRSPYKPIIGLIQPILPFLDGFNITPILSSGKKLKELLRPVCLSGPFLMQLCMHFYNLFLGPSRLMAPETAPLFLSHIPGGTSVQTLVFISDAIRGKFQKYDYGFARNFIKYGTVITPKFSVRNVRIPVAIFCSENDWATGAKDAEILYRDLPQQARLRFVAIRGQQFNHYDFLYSRQANRLVYKELFAILTSVT